MKTVKIMTNYYQQFDADYNLDVPGEGFGGWKKAELEINTERTAVVVMHAWNCGYKKAVDLTHSCQEPVYTIISDPVMDELCKYRMKESFYGIQNKNDVEEGFRNLDFAEEAKPVCDEGIAENADQLFALCRDDGINHLIYTGFAINWCLMSSPGGMIDMQRRGLMCSAIRQAVTAVENKETARYELHKEAALWEVALGFGFVYDLSDFINAIK